MVAAIACVDNKWGIGKDGELLLKIPEDMEFFKNTTSGGCCIMGRKTWDSLSGKPLSNRTNIIVSNTLKLHCDDVCVCNMEEIKRFIKYYNDIENIFVIGGAQIYKQLLPYCEEVYLTKIFEDLKADTFFPNLEKEWNISPVSDFKKFNGIAYRFYKCRRKNE